MDSNEQVTPPTPEQIAAAIEQAERQFQVEASKRAFSARIANRFWLQVEPDGCQATIMIGSTGNLFFGSKGEGAQLSTHVHVEEAYRVDVVWLQNLAKTINDLVGSGMTHPGDGVVNG
jgi:hypothetical protein